jgi:hypothetical protein
MDAFSIYKNRLMDNLGEKGLILLFHQFSNSNSGSEFDGFFL